MLPREKFQLHGLDSLSIENLVSIILSTGTSKQNVYQLSRKVCSQFKRGIVKYQELIELEGLGKVKAMKLVCAIELGKRLTSTKSESKKIIDSNSAYETLRYIANYKQEHIVCLFLNARYELLGKRTLGIGTVDSVNILPRDIILHSLRYNAISVIMAHNHPSGDISASQGDIDMTRRIKEALDLVGIKLLDHLIISNMGWGSVTI